MAPQFAATKEYVVPAIGQRRKGIMSILDEITQHVSQMSEEELRAEFIKAQEEKAKRKEKQLQYNSSPEAKAKRIEYQKQRNEQIKQDPEKYGKVVAQRKAYMQKPEVKAKMKAYRDERNLRMKLILQRAKELGLDQQVKAQQEAAHGQPTA